LSTTAFGDLRLIYSSKSEYENIVQLPGLNEICTGEVNY